MVGERRGAYQSDWTSLKCERYHWNVSLMHQMKSDNVSVFLNVNTKSTTC